MANHIDGLFSFMKSQLTLIVAAKWQQYLNKRKFEELLTLTEADIAVVDVEGLNNGHKALVDSINRTGLTLMTLKSYVKEGKLILKHRYIWKSEGKLKKKKFYIHISR